MTTELKRLGKRGAYRLGQLRSQGIREVPPPVPYRPRFARNDRRGPASAWVLGLLAGVVVIAASTMIGWWFMPFAAGLGGGLANRIGGWRNKVAVPAVAVMALAGWGIPAGRQMLHGMPFGAVAREAALAGLPRYAAVGIALTLLVAVAQAVVGYWLGRALTPRPDYE